MIVGLLYLCLKYEVSFTSTLGLFDTFAFLRIAPYLIAQTRRTPIDLLMLLRIDRLMFLRSTARLRTVLRKVMYLRMADLLNNLDYLIN